jgi:anaerobic magnesium-protoporphyrin IX monomethyl ester cyclase
LVKVALLNPSPPAVIQKWDKPTYPSLSLGYLTGFLKSKKIDVLAIDAAFDGLGINQMKELLSDFQPDILGFTAMTHRIIHVAYVANELKKLFPGSLIVVGGPHATVAPVRTPREFPVFDIAVIGEGELTMLDIIRTIEAEQYANPKKSGKEATFSGLASIKGIAWKYKGEIIINPPRDQILNLDSLPFPSYDYVRRRIDVYPIFSSRGCPHQCIFCCRIQGNKLRIRSAKNVIAEIKFAKNRYDPKVFDFADDTLTLPKNRAMEICSSIIAEKLNKRIKWTALSRVTGVDQELFNKMKEAGCIKVDFGVESGNPDILKIIKKNITIIDAENAVRMAKRAGLKTGSYFIIGHPFETHETIHDTISLATKLNTDTVSFGIMVPYPGTEIYKMAIKGDGNYKLISENWSVFDKQIGNALELRNLNRKELEKLQIKAYMKFYVNNYRFLDIARIIISQRKLLWKIITKRMAANDGSACSYLL